MKSIIIALSILCSISYAHAQNLQKKALRLSEETEKQVIEWRHYFHQYPELSNREFKTSEKIAELLRSMDIEVSTGIAHTGVVGILKGGKPGPVVALRADIDALPITEIGDLPYKSIEKSEYNGQSVGVMHACGHDTHISILLGTAKVLSQLRDDLEGTVKFIFQPAEEGAPKGEEGGAELMVKEGVLKNPDVDAIFGLHIWSDIPVGKIMYKPEGTMASANTFILKVRGKQTHGGRPWGGVDPIVASAQIINNIQTIVSRNVELTNGAAVVSIGAIHGGVRHNIIPEEVEMRGTIRAMNEETKELVFKRLREITTHTAQSNGLESELEILSGYPVTFNDPELTQLMVPSLQAAAGIDNVYLGNATTPAEDFSFYQKEVPGLYFHLGGMPASTLPENIPAHHTPEFVVDDSAMLTGMKAMSRLVIDYMLMKK